MIRSSLAEEPSWVAMTSPLRDVSPLQAYRALSDAALFWAKPSANEWAVGFGMADRRTTPRGDSTFGLLDELCTSSRRERLVWLADADCPPLGPWFGGFAFDRRRPPAAPWESFPAAQWVLPELMVWRRRGEETFATAFQRHVGGFRQAEGVVRSRLAAAIDRLQRASAARRERGRALVLTSDRLAWSRLVERALRAIESAAMSKVVVARRISAQADKPFHLPTVIERLCAAVPGCTVFAFRGSGGAAFIGATPEALCTVRGRSLESEAIAGSPPRPSEPMLIATDKEAREHRAVVDGIDEALRPLCSELDVDAAPGVLGLPHLRHLHTKFRGQLRGEVTLSELVAALHPTPAVGGVPRDRAMQFLAENEGLDRGWYAGPIGWVGSDAADLAVGIRSALLRGQQADLFVGAGIVAGSTSEGEWVETEAKSLTLLEAIGGGVGVR